MRATTQRLHRQRAQLDARLSKLRAALDPSAFAPPPRGWLKAIRESLGMSAEQLGERLGISKQAVLRLERGETRRTLTLQSLDRAAQALGCEVAYMLVPRATLEAQVNERADLVARRTVKRSAHSMALEDQVPPAELQKLQVAELAKALKEKLGPELWGEP